VPSKLLRIQKPFQRFSGEAVETAQTASLLLIISL
jgi:hypothetical protein